MEFFKSICSKPMSTVITSVVLECVCLWLIWETIALGIVDSSVFPLAVIFFSLLLLVVPAVIAAYFTRRVIIRKQLKQDERSYFLKKVVLFSSLHFLLLVFVITPIFSCTYGTACASSGSALTGLDLPILAVFVLFVPGWLVTSIGFLIAAVLLNIFTKKKKHKKKV